MRGQKSSFIYLREIVNSCKKQVVCQCVFDNKSNQFCIYWIFPTVITKVIIQTEDAAESSCIAGMVDLLYRDNLSVK